MGPGAENRPRQKWMTSLHVERVCDESQTSDDRSDAQLEEQERRIDCIDGKRAVSEGIPELR